MIHDLTHQLALTAWTIPSPAEGTWYLGPVPLRGYALSIILGIVATIWIAERRWVARGGTAGEIQDLAIVAVPFGLVGARAYHVATDAGRYFGEGNNPWEALYIWRGGLGIWGGIAMGVVGIVVASRSRGIRVRPLLDALAPAVLVGQAIGRWGNWFNQELYGRPTDLPWALEIDPSNWPAAQTFEVGTTFHPTFLYECLWSLAAFAVIVWLDRRHRLGHGQVAALYVMLYTAGRGWIEMLRIDDVQLTDVGGLRFNVWTSIVLFVLATAYLVWSRRRHPEREEQVHTDERVAADASAPVSTSGAEAVED